MGKKRLSDRTAPFVAIFAGLSGLGRIIASPPHTVGDYLVLGGILVGVALLVILGLANIRRHKRRALAELAPLRLPFTMACDVDVASMKRFGGWGVDPRLKVARTPCFIASDGNVIAISPLNRRRRGVVGPRPFSIDVSRAAGGYPGRHMSDVRPALIIQVPYPGGVEPVYLIRRNWSDSGIRESPLARFAHGLPT